MFGRLTQASTRAGENSCWRNVCNARATNSLCTKYCLSYYAARSTHVRIHQWVVNHDYQDIELSHDISSRDIRFPSTEVFLWSKRKISVSPEHGLIYDRGSIGLESPCLLDNVWSYHLATTKLQSIVPNKTVFFCFVVVVVVFGEGWLH